MSRTVKVGKLGEAYKTIVVDGAITYRTLIQQAGFSGADGVMADGYGNVILDEPVHDNVTTVVVSMPKFAGGVLPAGLRVVDENGNEWKPVNDRVVNEVVDDEVNDEVVDDDDWDDEDDDEVVDDEDDEVMDEVNDEVIVSRQIKVAQLGSPYKIVNVVGSATYRSVIQLAGFTSADGVFAEGLGSVILDEPVADSVTSIVVSMPKFAGGNLR
jgi:hypothetical protein